MPDSIPSWPRERVSEPPERRRRVHLISLAALIVVIAVAVAVVISGHKTGTSGPPLPSVGSDVVGTVTAVSSTSITLQVGDKATETAMVTESTKFLGQAHRIGEIRIGDRVGAALTEVAGRQHAYALEDPFGSPTSYPNG